MAKNIITTSEGNVRFEFPDTGKIINVHPNHIYTSFYIDTVSFMLIALPKSSGLAIMSSKAEDLEFDGQTYTFDQLPDVITEAFVEAGAQARWEVVDELPASGRSNTIYLVPKEEGSGFDEYIWLKDEGEWELIGDTDIELWRYLKKDDFNPYSAATKDYIDSVSGKVDTEIERATSAETALSTAIFNESVDRAAADNVLSGAIDTVSSALTDEVSARTEADTALDNKIDSVSGALDTAVSNLEAADAFISGAVDTLSSDLAIEAQRAQNAESALSGAIDTKLAISDFNTYSGAVETELNLKANSADVYSKSEVYTKAEVDEAIAEIDLSDYYTKSETDGLLDDKADLSALTEDERVWGAALNDLNSRINTVSGDVIIVSGTVDTKLDTSTFNTYSASVDTAIASKASQSAVDALNGVVTAHTANTTVHVTSAEKATWNNKSDFSGSYNDLTNKLSAGTNITIVDNVINATGGGSTYTAGDGIDISNDVISVTGKVDTSDFETYSGAVESRITEDEEVTAAGLNALNDRLSEDEEVTAAGLNAVNDKFDGLKLKKLTQVEYDALTTKDSNTLYIVI